MRRPRSPLCPCRLALAALLAALLVGTAGCEPVDLGPDFGDNPLPASQRVCYQDSDCTGNACCGLGKRPTHVEDAPDCRGVECTGDCPLDDLECGRCKVFCRESVCAAACTQ